MKPRAQPNQATYAMPQPAAASAPQSSGPAASSAASHNTTTGPTAATQAACPPDQSLIKDIAPILQSTIGGLIAFGIAWWSMHRAERNRIAKEAIEAERDLFSRAALKTIDLVNATVRYCDSPRDDPEYFQNAADESRNAARELQFILSFIIQTPDGLLGNLQACQM